MHSSQELFEERIDSIILQFRKLRQSHIANKWQNQNLNLGLSDFYIFLTPAMMPNFGE